jgi:hypothetical protein
MWDVDWRGKKQSSEELFDKKRRGYPGGVLNKINIFYFTIK